MSLDAASFPNPPDTRRPIGGIPVRTLGEFRALTASLPDDTLLTSDDDAVIELDHDADSDILPVSATPDL